MTRVELVAYSPAADVVLIRRADGVWLVNGTGERRIIDDAVGQAVADGGLVRSDEVFGSSPPSTVGWTASAKSG